MVVRKCTSEVNHFFRQQIRSAGDEQELQRLGGVLRDLRETRVAETHEVASRWDEEKFAAPRRCERSVRRFHLGLPQKYGPSAGAPMRRGDAGGAVLIPSPQQIYCSCRGVFGIRVCRGRKQTFGLREKRCPGSLELAVKESSMYVE